MSKTTVIVPSRNEQYLQQTVDDVIAHAEEEIEVIVVMDGPTAYPLNVKGKNVRLIFHSTPRGKRVCINHAASVATGDYLMMADAHCLFSQGYDRILQHDCDQNWVVILRRYTLDPDKWECKPPREPVDYYYLTCPWNNPKRFIIQSCPWFQRTRERVNCLPIDDTMTLQGSMWFMSTEHFKKRLGGMEIAGWGASSSADWFELGMKTWLSGGRVVINKNGYYAHLYKGNRPRGYSLTQQRILPQLIHASHYWATDQWDLSIPGRNFGWLVDHFWPLPTKETKVRGERLYWPENWREYYEGRI